MINRRFISLLSLFSCFISISIGFKFSISNLRTKDIKSKKKSELSVSTKPTFKRFNPLSDKFKVLAFHHLEFYCSDATTSYKRFMAGLGLDLVSKSDQSTGNYAHASYALQSGDIRMIFTAPYKSKSSSNENAALPNFEAEKAVDFFLKHGLGVRAIAIEVENVKESYNIIQNEGGEGVLAPVKVEDKLGGNGYIEIAEVKLYGDVVLRMLNLQNFKGSTLPNFEDLKCSSHDSNGLLGKGKFGLARLDHVVGNLYDLKATLNSIKKMTGFHEFAEFVSEDVGTVDSGLNSVVLASNNQKVLLPLNEPTTGTRRKSQIQTYLEQNQGEGVQHIALFTKDIISTMRKMKAATSAGGFEFQESLGKDYYSSLRKRLLIGDLKVTPQLTEQQLKEIEELGILADRDDQGILLQIFTRPIGDRPTVFLEIIQRIGCDETGEQLPGCGGFGKGNFRDLFKSIENFETQLKIN